MTTNEVPNTFLTGLELLTQLSNQYSKREVILTTPELHRMADDEFCNLCLRVIPEDADMVNSFRLHRIHLAGRCSSKKAALPRITQKQMNEIVWYAAMYKKTLICNLQRAYLRMDVAEMKKEFPSFFGDR